MSDQLFSETVMEQEPASILDAIPWPGWNPADSLDNPYNYDLPDPEAKKI